jgi:hypothetical protein
MTGLRKTLLVVGASAAIAIMAVIETPFAQTNGPGGNPGKSVTEPGATSEPTAADVDKMAEAAMTVPNSAPMTDVDRKAAASMQMSTSPAPAK